MARELPMQRVEVSFVGFPSAEKIGGQRESARLRSTGNPRWCHYGSFQPFSRGMARYEVSVSVNSGGESMVSSYRFSSRRFSFPSARSAEHGLSCSLLPSDFGLLTMLSGEAFRDGNPTGHAGLGVLRVSAARL